MKSFNTRNKGFSLIEILLVIGIIAVLAIAAFLVFPQVQASQRANAEQSNIQTVAAGIKNLYQGRYTGISNTTVNAARIFPANMNGGDNTTGTINSSWGGSVVIAPAGTPAGSQFTMTYADLADTVCLKLVPGLATNFDSVTVGGVELGLAAAAADRQPDDIVAACNATPTPLIVTSN